MHVAAYRRRWEHYAVHSCWNGRRCWSPTHEILATHHNSKHTHTDVCSQELTKTHDQWRQRKLKVGGASLVSRLPDWSELVASYSRMKSAWGWANGGQPILVCYIRKYVMILGDIPVDVPPNQNIGGMCPRHPLRGWRQCPCYTHKHFIDNVNYLRVNVRQL